MSEDRTQQDITEMKYRDFVLWATSYVLFGIAEGEKLRNLMDTVVNQCLMNKVFGGQKPVEKKE